MHKLEREAWASLTASPRGRRLIEGAKTVKIGDVDASESARSGYDVEVALELIAVSTIAPMHLSVLFSDDYDDNYMDYRKGMKPLFEKLKCCRLVTFAWSDSHYIDFISIITKAAKTLRRLDLEEQYPHMFSNIAGEPRIPELKRLEVVVIRGPTQPQVSMQQTPLLAAISKGSCDNPPHSLARETNFPISLSECGIESSCVCSGACVFECIRYPSYPSSEICEALREYTTVCRQRWSTPSTPEKNSG